MSRISNWLKLKPVVKTGKMNQYLEIPAFSERCGPTNQCIYIGDNAQGIITDSMVQDFSSGAAVEAWIKIISPSNTDARYICGYVEISGFKTIIGLAIVGRKLRGLFKVGGTVYNIDSVANIPEGNWVHVCMTYDGSAVNLYINGVFDSTGAAGTVDNITTTRNYVVGTDFNLSVTYGSAKCYIGFVRFRNASITAQEVKSQYDRLRNTTAADLVDDEIVFSALFHDGYMYEAVNSLVIAPTSSIRIYFADDFPPIIYGASFIPIQFEVSTSQSHSLKFPVNAPTADCNFGLYVSWTDDNGDFQRRKLFGPGIGENDINPRPNDYNGEKLPTTYALEVWNIDGRESVDLASTLRIETSILSYPTSSVDHSPVALTTPTQRTALWEPFPLTGFPLAFDNPQTNW